MLRVASGMSADLSYTQVHSRKSLLKHWFSLLPGTKQTASLSTWSLKSEKYLNSAATNRVTKNKTLLLRQTIFISDKKLIYEF